MNLPHLKTQIRIKKKLNIKIVKNKNYGDSYMFWWELST